MTWLWQNYLKRHVPTLIVAVMFMIIEGSMLGALSWMMQPMFDTVFVPVSYTHLTLPTIYSV